MASGLKAKYDPPESVRELVKFLVAWPMTAAAIRPKIINPATGKPLSMPTFRKTFAVELETSVAMCGVAVRQNLHSIATLGKGPAAVSAAKVWLEFVERIPKATKSEISGPNEAPLAIQVDDVTNLSDDERAQRVAKLIAIAAQRKRDDSEDEDAEDGSDGEAAE